MSPVHYEMILETIYDESIMSVLGKSVMVALLEPRLAARQIGPYRVLALLGKGGMGEVYRAKDSKLDREVAIKVLPEAFLADPDRLARLHREARVLASLNHPNIATIHSLEESGASCSLVMELVSGLTLAERLAGGAVPVEESLRIGRQVADALAAAHRQGITHVTSSPPISS